MGTVVGTKYRLWQKAEDNSIQTKGVGPFTQVLRLHAKPLAEGRYRIQWSWEARLQSGSTSLPTLQCTVDGTPIGNKTFKSPDQNWDGGSGWDFSLFNEGDTPDIKILVRRIGGTDTVEVRRLKLSIERMLEE